MTGRRTVTVPTIDHALIVLLEPSWCLGEHPAEGHRVDIAHSGPETAVLVDTGRGPVAESHHLADVLAALSTDERTR